jgi:hypothetical protein
VLEGDHDDEEDTGPVRLWPAAVALGLAAVLAAVIAVVVLADGDQQAETDGESVMRIVRVVPDSGGRVQLVLEEGGCALPTRATAYLRADAIAFTVYGRPMSEVCTADIKTLCAEVQLTQSVGPRRVLPRPAVRTANPVGPLLARGCGQIPVEEA